MNTVLKPEVRLTPLTQALLNEVLWVEHHAYSHPWTRGHFVDSLTAGYPMFALVGGDTLVGYFVAMQGVDEVHLLNLTVAPEFQGQGYGVLMLDALAVWSRQHAAQWLWLEVRQSNTRAIRVYQRYGFARVGERKHYYPAAHGQREHAVLMSLKL